MSKRISGLTIIRQAAARAHEEASFLIQRWSWRVEFSMNMRLRSINVLLNANFEILLFQWQSITPNTELIFFQTSFLS